MSRAGHAGASIGQALRSVAGCCILVSETLPEIRIGSLQLTNGPGGSPLIDLFDPLSPMGGQGNQSASVPAAQSPFSAASVWCPFWSHPLGGYALVAGPPVALIDNWTRAVDAFESHVHREDWRGASLAGVPFSNAGYVQGGRLRWMLDRAYAWARPPYSARSLFHYKGQFNPTWEPLYLVCEPGGRLELALPACLRALLPEFGLAHIAAALGLSAVAGTEARNRLTAAAGQGRDAR